MRRALHCLQRSRCRTVITSEDGREQVLKVFRTGCRSAETFRCSTMSQTPRMRLRSRESTIAIIAQADILGLLRRHPEVCIDVIRLFASRLRAFTNR